MTAKTMAEVIEGHRLVTGETWDGDYYQFCTCQQDAMPELDGRYADHLAAALSAAGFGLVADTKAERGWLAKNRNPDGSVTIIGHFRTGAEAEKWASMYPASFVEPS